MFLDPVTQAINATVNQQMLTNGGMPTADATTLAAAITAMNVEYRLRAEDVPFAMRHWRNGVAPAAIAPLLPNPGDLPPGLPYQ